MKTQHEVESYLNLVNREVEKIEKQADEFKKVLDEYKLKVEELEAVALSTPPPPEEPVIRESSVVTVPGAFGLYDYLSLLYGTQLALRWVLGQYA